MAGCIPVPSLCRHSHFQCVPDVTNWLISTDSRVSRGAWLHSSYIRLLIVYACDPVVPHLAESLPCSVHGCSAALCVSRFFFCLTMAVHAIRVSLPAWVVQLITMLCNVFCTSVRHLQSYNCNGEWHKRSSRSTVIASVVGS